MSAEITNVDLYSFGGGGKLNVNLNITRKVVIDGEEYDSRKKYQFETVKEAIEYLYKEVSAPERGK